MPPKIPPRIFSLPDAKKFDTEAIKNVAKRRVTSFSKMQSAESTIDWVKAKAESLETDIEEAIESTRILQEALENKEITLEEYHEAATELTAQREKLEAQRAICKKQRRILVDDLDEEQFLSRKTRGEAFLAAMVSRVTEAQPKQNKKKFPSDFGQRVRKFYGAERKNEATGEIEHFCCVTGWGGTVKAAHLVPKTLDLEELYYLFDVEDGLLLQDTRVALPLLRKIEENMDAGNCVVVPTKKSNGQLEWKLVVTRNEILNSTVSPQIKWKEIHGRVLEFQNSNRPAKRFLYFRYLSTYMQCLREKRSTEWADESLARGYMWSTPGRYLRQSMVKLMARKCGDLYLPEVFYTLTFNDQDSQIPTEQEEFMARKLSTQIQDHVLEKRFSASSLRDDDSEEED